jgi:hypothetical protein
LEASLRDGVIIEGSPRFGRPLRRELAVDEQVGVAVGCHPLREVVARTHLVVGDEAMMPRVAPQVASLQVVAARLVQQDDARVGRRLRVEEAHGGVDLQASV